MFEKLIQKQIKSFLKPALKNFTAGLKKYKDNIKLEEGELTVAGLILMDGENIKISACTMKKGVDKLEVSRHLQSWNVSELEEMLTNNIDKVDFSEALTE